MNGRVKELEKLALDHASDVLEESARGGIPEFNRLFTEKLAELIIRECVKVCNDVDAEYKGEDVLATWCARAIEEHFGVDK